MVMGEGEPQSAQSPILPYVGFWDHLIDKQVVIVATVIFHGALFMVIV